MGKVPIVANNVISVVGANVVSSSSSKNLAIGAVTTRVDVTFRVTTRAEAVLKFVYTNVAADVVGGTVGDGVVGVDVVCVDVLAVEVTFIVLVLGLVVVLAAAVVVPMVVVVVLELNVVDNVVLIVSTIFCETEAMLEVLQLLGPKVVVVSVVGGVLVVCLRRLKTCRRLEVFLTRLSALRGDDIGTRLLNLLAALVLPIFLLLTTGQDATNVRVVVL